MAWLHIGIPNNVGHYAHSLGLWSIAGLVETCPSQGSCARSPTKFNAFQGLSFNNSRPIQCPSSFCSIQPYWYSRKKTHWFEAL